MTFAWLAAVALAYVAVTGAWVTTHDARGDDDAFETDAFGTDAFGTDAELHSFFERHVRPLLVERCGKCHGARRQESGLRVDTRAGLLAGGDRGAAVVPEDVAGSLLLQAVRREGDLQMPPSKRLTVREIQTLERWIAAGAAWPESSPMEAASAERSASDHWAFQPVPAPIPPRAALGSDVRTPVDLFVQAGLAGQGMLPSPPADRRTLIRRVSFALRGLPPTWDEVERFVDDADPRAYERLVERLLASPQYGEHWGRRWLDVARYSDTKGYVYAREERFWTHAWTYRDWVVRAWNDDLAYDRFLLLQLAADQLEDHRRDDLAAMGFLTLGRRFLGVRRDVIDDRIDVVSRGTMGLTVACARCHDHKYDPIPTADYYSLYGVFDSCREQQQVLANEPGDVAFREELAKRQQTLDSKLTEYRGETEQRARARVSDYLFAQTELHKFPADGFDQVFQKSDLLPAFVRRWQRYLRQARLAGESIFGAWRAYAKLDVADDAAFARQSQAVTGQLATLEPPPHPRIAAAFATPPQSFREVCQRYGEVLAEVDQQWQAGLAAAKESNENPPVALDDPRAEALRQVLYGDDAPCRVPPGPVSLCETYFDSGRLTELWKLQGEVDRWLINAPTPVPVALTLVDRARPVEPRVFRRGNPLQLGDDVPRRFLEVLGGDDRQPFRHGSGRHELARAIVDPHNPLTARVIVNRVWAQHFGRGLVATPSDFGLRADPPSHPELLDWLAHDLIRSGWSLKRLQRLIVLSATFRQSSLPQSEAADRAMRVDPENRWLWRMSPRRLTFEELRDSLLAVTATLDMQLGGKPVDLFAEPFPQRRTLYGLVDRQYFPGTLRVFDFANPDLHVPQRTETTVPQQALFFMNHPLLLAQAKALADQVRDVQRPREGVARMFRRAYQRDPSDRELADAFELLLSEREAAESEAALDAWEQLAQVLLCTNEFLFID